MGLAGPRKKTKISHDPNNTNWSRSTSGYGHKILSSQGWTPGSFLGAKNAAHADMFTAASAAHIKVVVKDDTLGLGAKSMQNRLDEPTGLDAFKGLLGRLNGKTDTDLAQEQRKRDDAKLARYAVTRWPAVRFISGGLLAQEKIETNPVELFQKEKRHRPELVGSASSGNEHQKMNGCQASTGEFESSTGDSQKMCQRSKVRKNSKAHTKLPDIDGAKSDQEREKNAKKRKRTGEDNSHSALDCQEADKDRPTNNFSGQKHLPSPNPTTGSKERRPVGRHTFRGRHIEAKKRALLDDKSLSEVILNLV
ncbi:hypothetical protein PHISCL_04395 [Aspergillus sclerotialis]|uniref:Protein PXR1 n=1 Tax=Aspergillus sclerotialis TaxID=2070753 RepID=A0A3A2ZL44_9EURO|nr:hypothetical protein PHISCL_04395 [Aspergillus sclerotialis]